MTTSTATAYRTLTDAFADVAGSLDREAWTRPSPCQGWSAADVVDHVVSTQRDFLAERDLPAGDAPDTKADPAAAFASHASTVAALLEEPANAQKTFDGFFGPTTVGEALLTFYGFDLVVHRWDVARAGGSSTTFSEAEMDVVETSVDGFGEHLYMEGICTSAVEVGADASRQDRLLARLGRDPA